MKKCLSVFNDTHKEELNLLQEFIKIRFCRLLIFSICLHNQFKSDSLSYFYYKFKVIHQVDRKKMALLISMNMIWFLS